jgi:hypothetical protein
MSDTRSDDWLGPRTVPVEPRLELQRTLWTMRRDAKDKPINAAIYATAAGRELRVTYGHPDSLLDSLLSRTDDAPLTARAEHLRERAVRKGLDTWRIPPSCGLTEPAWAEHLGRARRRRTCAGR